MSIHVHELRQDSPAASSEPRSFDFRGKREIDWSDVELELCDLDARATAVEILGRGACDTVHGERMQPVFALLSADIHKQINRLKELLGLASEVRS